jgi:hypothetical protein
MISFLGLVILETSARNFRGDGTKGIDSYGDGTVSR